MTVKQNLARIQQEIDAACQRVGREKNSVKIIAVTKYVSDERAKEALEAGISHIGENRAEEGARKWHVLNGNGTWHFIGTLQSRKVKEMIEIFDYIHSLDRLSLAKEIQKRASKIVKCFIQVNVSGEDSKHGLQPSQLIEFVTALSQFSFIEVVGLMTMAPNEEDPEATRPNFRKLKDLQKEVQALKLPYAPCEELSMGMSNDFHIAIEEGATFVRIGTSLVGKEM
ncbi:YggS family pyridoxal phosphate-dependent enzyme [Anaerobacillus isosaccharinicus]|uniref:Pyridoxal phosphate homeostasis protein n=1 Tax=Anaerobacillus isosaccharinicus TaxID=1532552 RepID=A0A1S2M7G3_9BACI|nr:YggS family pyridoxal phosphate-dependent enzyme [Anaerobacillus isosaccharinicus]MBA5587424.1 YggS family pyridoxal phosphate-dependent enzyme [Anaerobacillus isosaccharinicus]QOY34387.1 YggS family pyridoxal phosphate-dependent enzyme [Anaerobacillus isosaccharinicus]